MTLTMEPTVENNKKVTEKGPKESDKKGWLTLGVVFVLMAFCSPCFFFLIIREEWIARLLSVVTSYIALTGLFLYLAINPDDGACFAGYRSTRLAKIIRTIFARVVFAGLAVCGLVFIAPEVGKGVWKNCVQGQPLEVVEGKVVVSRGYFGGRFICQDILLDSKRSLGYMFSLTTIRRGANYRFLVVPGTELVLEAKPREE